MTLKAQQQSRAYIGLGSNLGNPSEQISTALKALAQLPACQQLQCARWYQSKAIGPGDQPDYINTVVRLRTSLQPMDLLLQLQGIEDHQGRQRHLHWGARTLDLDLLLYNNECCNSDRLQLPHPEIQKRSFVLMPLFDLAPELVLPDGSVLSNLVKECDSSDLRLAPHESNNESLGV